MVTGTYLVLGSQDEPDVEALAMLLESAIATLAPGDWILRRSLLMYVTGCDVCDFLAVGCV
jgi:hypothetical protein